MIRDHPRVAKRTLETEKKTTLRLRRLQHTKHAFEIADQFLDCLRPTGINRLGIFERELVARTADGKALDIEEAADLTYQHDVVTLIVAAIAAPLYGL